MVKRFKTVLFLLTVITVLGIASEGRAASELNAEVRAHMEGYASEAKKADPGFSGFSAEAGKEFFYGERLHSVKKKLRSCTTCHTKDPSKPGKTTVGKVIDPVSPAVNPERFTSVKKIEKWFRRNCKWVLERECTPREKGDYITYMFSLED